MKTINIIPTIIAVAVAALIGLLAAYLCDASSSKSTTIGVTTGISLAISLLPMLAIKSDNPRLNVNLRIVSTIFTLLILLVNFIVCFNPPEKSFTIYFIIVGLIILIFIGVLYSLVRASTDSD